MRQATVKVPLEHVKLTTGQIRVLEKLRETEWLEGKGSWMRLDRVSKIYSRDRVVLGYSIDGVFHETEDLNASVNMLKRMRLLKRGHFGYDVKLRRKGRKLAQLMRDRKKELQPA